MNRTIALIASFVFLAGLAGCQGGKDYSKTEIKPEGTPNPNLPTLTPGGASNAPASGPARSTTGVESK